MAPRVTVRIRTQSSGGPVLRPASSQAHLSGSKARAPGRLLPEALGAPWAGVPLGRVSLTHPHARQLGWAKAEEEEEGPCWPPPRNHLQPASVPRPLPDPERGRGWGREVGLSSQQLPHLHVRAGTPRSHVGDKAGPAESASSRARPPVLRHGGGGWAHTRGPEDQAGTADAYC